MYLHSQNSSLWCFIFVVPRLFVFLNSSTLSVSNCRRSSIHSHSCRDRWTQQIQIQTQTQTQTQTSTQIPGLYRQPKQTKEWLSSQENEACSTASFHIYRRQTLYLHKRALYFCKRALIWTATCLPSRLLVAAPFLTGRLLSSSVVVCFACLSIAFFTNSWARSTKESVFHIESMSSTS